MKKQKIRLNISSLKKEEFMKSSIIEAKELSRKLEIIIPAQHVNLSFKRQYEKLQKTAKIPGFRPGKVPLNALKQSYQGSAHNAVMDDLFQNFYYQALALSKITNPASPAKLLDLDLQENQDCRFIVTLEVHPEITIKNYQGLELKKFKKQITDQEIDEALERLQIPYSQLEDLNKDGALKKEDFFTVDLEVLNKTTNQELFKQKDILLQAGAQNFSPEVDKLIGCYKGEVIKFFHQFPKNYHNTKIAGQYLLCKAKLTGFKKIKLPPLDDELAKKYGLDNLKDLKVKVKQKLEQQNEKEIKSKLEKELIKQLIEKNPIPLIPKHLMQEKMEELTKQAKIQLTEQKWTEESQNKFLIKNKSVLQAEAIKHIKGDYLITKLIEVLNITYTTEDITKYLAHMFPKKTFKEAKKTLEQQNRWSYFIYNLKRQKTISHLIKTATFK